MIQKYEKNLQIITKIFLQNIETKGLIFLDNLDKEKSASRIHLIGGYKQCNPSCHWYGKEKQRCIDETQKATIEISYVGDKGSLRRTYYGSDPPLFLPEGYYFEFQLEVPHGGLGTIGAMKHLGLKGILEKWGKDYSRLNLGDLGYWLDLEKLDHQKEKYNL